MRALALRLIEEARAGLAHSERALAALERLILEPPEGEPPENRVKIILAECEKEWSLPVAEPPGPNWQRIDRYIRDDSGLGWHWEDPYTADGMFAWCGAFVAAIYSQVNLRASIRVEHMASCRRLVQWAENTDRMRQFSECLPGDIVIVGHSENHEDRNSRKYGNHITICREYRPEDNKVLTWEGNAWGPAPDDQEHEGVIRYERPIVLNATQGYRMRFVIRPLEEDYDG